jgi:peptidoglycan lytic transglycosylase D
MRISRYHDDRFDPTTETRAAAELLRSNYDALGSWPLAITAYNYGTGGTSAAASEYGGDYDRIVRSYNGPHFGFAARNYYSEFLAALQIHQDEEKYFPDLKYAEVPAPPPIRTDFAPPPSRHSHHGSLHRVVAHHGRHSQHHTHTVHQARNTQAVNRGAGIVTVVHHPNHHSRSKPIVAEEQTSDHDS